MSQLLVFCTAWNNWQLVNRSLDLLEQQQNARNVKREKEKLSGTTSYCSMSIGNYWNLLKITLNPTEVFN